MTNLTFYGFALLIATFLFWKTPSAFSQQLARWDQSISVVVATDTLPLAWVGGLNAVQYNTFDFDNDARNDLLLFDRTSNTLHPFRRGADQWVYVPEYVNLFPSELQSWIMLKDYDGDGDQDLFTASGGRGISVYRNESSGDGLVNWTLVADPLRTTAFASGAEVTLQVNASDYPAIIDVDQDGDLDVVNYNVIGSGELILHQNQSVEQYGHADSLVYRTVDIRWGEVEECDCGLFAFGDQSCEDLDSGSRQLSAAKLQHVGGKTLLVLDADGDRDLDVLSGDEGCFGMTLLENEPINSQVSFQEFELGYPANAYSSASIFFPGAYLADGDGDGVCDLMLSPNASTNVGNSIDFKNSNWMYRNEGTAQEPQWQWSTSAFLQQDMIDVGEDAVPALSDYDADGDLDLFVGSRGTVRADGFYSGLHLYENIGTAQQPTFRFVTDDFLQLSEWKLQELKPYFADVNQDALPDLILSGRESVTRETRLYVLLNQATVSGGPYIWKTEQRQALELPFRSEDNLAFFDVDQDQQMDVLVGKQSGNLIYYRNQSESFPPRWVQEDEAFAGIGRNARGLFLAPTVMDVNQDGKAELLSTDVSGYLLLRSHADGISLDTDAPVVDTVMNQNSILLQTLPVRLGRQSWLAAGRLSGSGNLSVIIGSQRGGISLLQLSNQEPPSERLALLLYPNPTDGSTTLRTQSGIRSFEVINTAGQVVYDEVLSNPVIQTGFNVATLPTGLYIVRTFLDQGQAVSAKLLVHH